MKVSKQQGGVFFTRLLACVLALVVTGGAVSAQEMHVSGISLEWEGWRLKPVYYVDSGAVRVAAFVALAEAQTVSGSNIVAVWYVRSTSTPATWSTKSWATTNPAEAVKSVKSAMGISADEDSNWGLDAPLAILPGEDITAPSDYDLGVLATDALHPVLVMMPNPGPLLALLTQMGYPAANISLETTPGCDAPVLLEEMAAAFEWGIAQPFATDLEAAAMTEGVDTRLAAVTGCGPGCTPNVTTVAGPVTPGACVWAYVDSSSIPAVGGAWLTCNYEARKYFRQYRTTKTLHEDCSVTVCTQVNTGYAASGASTTIWVPSGSVEFCPSSPTGLGPPCLTTVGTATGASVWLGWAPECPS